MWKLDWSKHETEDNNKSKAKFELLMRNQDMKTMKQKT